MNRRQIYEKLLVHLIIYTGIVLFCIFVLPKLVVFFLPFVIGWIIASIANPLVHFLEKHIRLVRKHGSMLVIIGAILLIAAGLYALITAIVSEVHSLLLDLPQFYTEALTQLTQISDSLEQIFKNIPFLSGKLEGIVSDLPVTVTDLISNSDLSAWSTATHAFHSVADILLAIIIVFLSAYFFTVERENIARILSEKTPAIVKKYTDMIVSIFTRAVGGYFKAQFKLAIVVFIVLYLGFKIIDIKYSCMLAILVAFLDFLPVFGTGFVLWPWMAADLVLGNYMETIILLVIYALCQLIKQILQPKMVGDSIGISPIMTLFFLYIGYKLRGFLGMLISIPIGMIVIEFYRAGMFQTLEQDAKNVGQDIWEHYWK